MKNILFAQLFIVSALVFQSCDRELISSGFPNVITISAEDQGENLVFSGELKNDGDIPVNEIGFIWQNSDDPFSKPGFSVRSEKTSSGNFSAEISWSLIKDQDYVLRAWARCGEKTVYGEKLNFKAALSRPCQLFRIEPDSAYRGQVIRFIGKGFNQTIQYNKVYIDGKSAVVTAVNDSVLTCIVPFELTKGSGAVNIMVNGIGGNFKQIFKLLLPPPPQVLTKSAQNIKWFSAKPEGSVNPNGLSCMVTFDYGLTTNYGLSVNAIPGTVSGDSVTNVTATLTNLSPASIYHFRIKAVSESGVSYGEDMLFLTPEAPTESENVTDIDGNVYETVIIGNQIWMKKNLIVTRYHDGTVIPLVSNGSEWTNPFSGAYCAYENNTANITIYGALYNWYAVTSPKGLCPEGWHVPSDEELTELTTYLGGLEIAGGKMKESGTQHWNTPNTGADNSSGFTAVGAGFRDVSGIFSQLRHIGYLWSSSEYDISLGTARKLFNDNAGVSFSGNNKKNGFSVRCIKD